MAFSMINDKNYWRMANMYNRPQSVPSDQERAAAGGWVPTPSGYVRKEEFEATQQIRVADAIGRNQQELQRQQQNRVGTAAQQNANGGNVVSVDGVGRAAGFGMRRSPSAAGFGLLGNDGFGQIGLGGSRLPTMAATAPDDEDRFRGFGMF